MNAHLTAAIMTATLLLAAPALHAADTGDASALIGKTCQGIFNNGKHQLVSRGALQLQLTGDAGHIVGHLWRKFGADAYGKVQYEMTQGQFVALDGFQDVGAVRQLTLAGKEIHFTDAIGIKFALIYGNGGVYGQGDPRGGNDPRMTVPSIVSMICK